MFHRISPIFHQLPADVQVMFTFFHRSSRFTLGTRSKENQRLAAVAQW
jgi:hypothetical protein